MRAIGYGERDGTDWERKEGRTQGGRGLSKKYGQLNDDFKVVRRKGRAAVDTPPTRGNICVETLRNQ